MKLKKFLTKTGMSKLKFKYRFLEMEFNIRDADKDAAWELYVELLTRISTQNLLDNHGDEKTALTSIYSLFSITRETIKRNGRSCIQFTKIAIVVLNQCVRPFTAKWHKLSIEGAFDDNERCLEFRDELRKLQETLCLYTEMLAYMADVEVLTNLQDNDLCHEK